MKWNEPISFCLLAVLMGAFAFTGCREEVKELRWYNPLEMDEAFALSNKHLNLLEEEQIRDFIHRFGWNMQETGSGLRYKILEEGEGPEASYGQGVLLDYEIYLLTGDPVYSSAEKGPMEFIVGRGGVESGLEEGILRLNKGSRAYFIMPHHLAHGLPGDGNRIPRRATIVYHVHLLEIY